MSMDYHRKHESIQRYLNYLNTEIAEMCLSDRKLYVLNEDLKSTIGTLNDKCEKLEAEKAQIVLQSEKHKVTHKYVSDDRDVLRRNSLVNKITIDRLTNENKSLLETIRELKLHNGTVGKSYLYKLKNDQHCWNGLPRF